jgi:hypothetical protein
LHWDAGAILPLTVGGSKAGATFRLAMISTGSGLKPRASQRCRNNCLTLEMENGAPANFSVSRDPPPPWCARGRGGWRAISRPKNNIQYHIVPCSNRGDLTVGSTRYGHRERADVANHIYAQRLPLQMLPMPSLALRCATGMVPKVIKVARTRQTASGDRAGIVRRFILRGR